MQEHVTKAWLIGECRKLCVNYNLDQVYLAEVVGTRRHFLAGYGRPRFEQPKQLMLSEHIALFWHGELPEAVCAVCPEQLRALTQYLEEYLEEEWLPREVSRYPHGLSRKHEEV